MPLRGGAASAVGDPDAAAGGGEPVLRAEAAPGAAESGGAPGGTEEWGAGEALVPAEGEAKPGAGAAPGGEGSQGSQAAGDPMLLCWECGQEPTLECAMCGQARYCGIECQETQWGRHRDACRSLRPLDRTEGPHPPRADWESVAYRYAAGDPDAIILVDQVSPWALEWIPTDADALTPRPSAADLRGLPAEAVNDKRDYRAVLQQRQRRALFLSVRFSKPYTLHPTPCTVNPRPETQTLGPLL